MRKKSKKDIEVANKNIQELVCKFYLDNKEACDVNYNVAEDKKIIKIYENITYDANAEFMFSKVSIVILTANKYEKNILHQNIYKINNKRIKRVEIHLFKNNEKGITFGYLFEWKSYTVLHIEAQNTGSYTIGGSADVVRYVMNNDCLYPIGFVSLGICFGTDESKCNMGDVVISQKLYPYSVGSKIMEDDYFVNDDNMFRVKESLLTKINSLDDQNIFSEFEMNVHIGNYITGESVVSSIKERDIFANTTTQKILSGEMEGYGLFKECQGTDFLYPCLIIKAICDWAAMKNFDFGQVIGNINMEGVKVSGDEARSIKDRIQAYASFNAFQVLDALFENNIFGEDVYFKTSRKVKSIKGDVATDSNIKRIIKDVASGFGKDITDKYSENVIVRLCQDGILKLENIDKHEMKVDSFYINKGGNKYVTN